MRRRQLLLLVLFAAACDTSKGNQLLRGGARGNEGLPPNDVIASIPQADIAGTAESDLATRIPNPYDKNPQAIQQGHDLFLQMNCASCHGYGAKGGMGPDLTDTYWRFGGAPVEIYKSIFEGRAEGMPAWGNALPADQIWKVVAYIQSLGGSVPAAFAQKNLQGDVPKENEPTDTARMSTQGKKQ
jgi:cytochrome c oxidase cbb3-type subunit 3